jgi:ornithine racemase
MATLKIHPDRIIKNIEKMNRFLSEQGKEWSLVTKVLNGHKHTLEKILDSDVIKGTHSIADSRISSIRTIKKINNDIVTMYLKPPAKSTIKNIIRYADISLNTDFQTIKLLNDEAKNQDIIHRIIIMIEMGELREGVVRDRFLEFYEKVFDLSNINVIGLGTNLGCMYGIEPTFDKLIQLCLYEQLIETRFNQNLELVSGGSSITLPLLKQKKVPKGVNHLRIGEAVFLGTSPLQQRKFMRMSTNAFEFIGNIVELQKKENMPDGIMGSGNVGHAETIDTEEKLQEEYKALLDFGVIDVDSPNLTPKNRDAQFLGTTSDLTVYSVGLDISRYQKQKLMHFDPNYMAVARLMNSKFITKQVT